MLTSSLQPTNYSIENIFNIYDGVIIMTKHDPKSPSVLADASPAPPTICSDWSDATFQQWMAMHTKDKRHSNVPQLHLDTDFPPTHPAELDSVFFQHRCVAGRAPSPLRKPLSYYVQLSGEDMTHMRQNLNYIVMCGGAISDDALPVILRCLESRNKDARGKGPVWGAHEVFDVGSW